MVREENMQVYAVGHTSKDSLPIRTYRTYIQKCKKCNKMRVYRFDI